jgi:hypothetical protein
VGLPRGVRGDALALLLFLGIGWGWGGVGVGLGGGVGAGVGVGGRVGGEVAEGYAPYLGVGYCREGDLLGEKCFEGLPRGVREDALACRGHPYMF